MSFAPNSDQKTREKQERFLKAQLEKEREMRLKEEIERVEKERSKKKGLKILKNSGILDAYEHTLECLCKYGLPTGDLYEFCALTVLKYEKKFKTGKKRDLQDRLKNRDDTRKKQLDGLSGEPEVKAIKADPKRKKSQDDDDKPKKPQKDDKKKKPQQEDKKKDNDKSDDDKKSAKKKPKKDEKEVKQDKDDDKEKDQKKKKK